ncbi:hypothetical protein ACFXKC_13845 [Streptomyces sp. NPDC059340]|uniref:hypothetical protein n=1 Tax=Streptomyces sp. NPDC059340 TaxID=3346806 RepID=UPI0036C08F5D
MPWPWPADAVGADRRLGRPLDFAAAATVEQTVAAGLEWAYGHAVHAAAMGVVPGRVMTATPEAYDRTGVWAVDIGKP